MKRKLKLLMIILIITISLKSNSAFAQITLDYSNDSITFGGEFYCTDIGNNDFKYVLLHLKSNSFSLYNMDMSPFMTNIPIPVTTDSLAQGFTVIYVTKTLFDCDSTNIEYVYERAVGGGLSDPFRIFRTDGTLLFQEDSANGPFGFGGTYGGSVDIRPIKNTSDGTKLFLQKKNSQYGSGILIYSLCGELPVMVYDFSDNQRYVRISPNPTNSKLNFEIVPPNNLDEFHIDIFDNNARQIMHEKVSWGQKTFTLDVGALSSGTYIFSLVSSKKVYQTDKFIISR